MLCWNRCLPSAEILYVLAMPEPARRGAQHWPPVKQAGAQLLNDPQKVACADVRTAASSPDAVSEAL